MDLASIALPGCIPESGTGKGTITPGSILRDAEGIARHQAMLDEKTGRNTAPDIKVKKVSVRIFDLSDADQVKEYEKLWTELLEKTARNEVIVESQKNLVNRKDGTSYWMKYVEYVEFGDAREEAQSKDGGARK